MNAICRIRCEVFRVTQSEMAAIAKVHQPTISRWEAGINDPSLHHLKRIREEAIRRRLRWDDDLLFAAGGTPA